MTVAAEDRKVDLVQRLATRAVEAGVAFEEHSPVRSVEDLEAERVVFATDGSGRGLIPELDEALWPAVEALRRSGLDVLPVVDGPALLGLLTRPAVMATIAARAKLGTNRPT